MSDFELLSLIIAILGLVSGLLVEINRNTKK